MVKLLRQCFPDRAAAWEPELERMIPVLAGPAATGAVTAEPEVGEEPVAAQA
jgi:hypothetical protein